MSDNNPDGGMSIDTFEFEEKLARIRLQVQSKLDNQKQLAVVLLSIEENLAEQGNGKEPLHYFISFLSLLEQSVQEGNFNQELATTTAYFLDLVFPYTPKALLKGKFSEILSKLAPAISNSASGAPLIRSSVGALESLLLAQDLQQWQNKPDNKISPRLGMVALLDLSLDARPKVRRRAQEAIHKILANPPPGPASNHIAAPVCAEVSLKKLAELVNTRSAARKQNDNKEINGKIIHCLQLISAVTSANAWPADRIENLCDMLLEISRTTDQFLVSTAFNAFEGLFNSMTNEIDNDKFLNVLNIIFDLKPSVNDTHLAAAWIAVIAKALSSYATLEPLQCITKIPEVFKIVSGFLNSEVSDIYVSASQCLIAIISNCIDDKYLLLPDNVNGISGEVYESVDEVITELSTIFEDLLSVKYRHCAKEVTEVLTVIFEKLRTRANPDFLKSLEIVGEWRSNEKNFDLIKEAEGVIGAAITSLGPDVVLGALPLNLDKPNKAGRAWLLPLLRDNIRNARLGLFKSDFIPLIESFTTKVEQLPKESESSTVFNIIISQIWSLLPHFCDLPTDLTKSFDDEFAQNLASLLYSTPNLRSEICQALRLLVESNLTYASGALVDDILLTQQFPVAEAQNNVEYLSSKSSQIVSVLFNVFSQTTSDSRGFVGETINSYLQIVPKDDLEGLFNNVCTLLRNALNEEAGKPQTQAKPNGIPKVSLTMMDLIVSMARYVPESSYFALFSIFSETVSNPDASIQKRSYRIVSKLMETEEGKMSLSKYITNFEESLLGAGALNISSRAARLSALLAIVELLPSTDLYFIPSIIQEIVICTKDVNEKTRELAYSILIKMGHKMSEGGIVDHSRLPGADSDAPKTEASLNEYFQIISAGLAADTPHMISATITAVSCLVYEFKEQMDVNLLTEMASTVELFLTDNNKEVAKSAIGFVKVEVLSLPEEMVRENMKPLLEKLMRWSHEHTGHFKLKIKHIIERLIRKFGMELVEQSMPQEDIKLIANIRKTKNREKRKEKEAAEEQANGEKKTFRSAYEEALYDSDDSEAEEEEEKQSGKKGKGKSKQFILNSEDPLDLLDRQALAHISSTKPKKFTKKEVKAGFESKNGKLVFRDEGEEDPLKDLSGIDAYIEAVKAGPVRGQKNKLKYKKSKDNDEDMDGGSDDEKPAPKKFAKGNNRGKVFGKPGVSKPQQKFKARKKF